MPTEKEFLAKKALLDTKQDKLIAGTNIQIDPVTNRISATNDAEIIDVQVNNQSVVGVDKIARVNVDTIEPNPASSPTDTLTSVDINGIVYELQGGGGDANYEELTQAEYDALTPAEKMNGTIYFITDGESGGGSSVIPNPEGEATDTLNTISIDGTIFDIAGSGGGSEGACVVLDDTNRTALNTQFELLDSIENYNFLIILTRWIGGDGNSFTGSFIMPTVSIEYNTGIFIDGGANDRMSRIVFSNATHYSIIAHNNENDAICGIYGVKLGSGGSSGTNSEIIPITAGDGTNSRTFTFDKIPKKISMQYVASGWGFYRDIIWGCDRSYYQASQATTSDSATYIGVSALSCDDTNKTLTITGLNAIQASNTADIVGYMYVDYGEASSSSGATKDILYSNTSGAPTGTVLALTHNFRDYDEIYMKISNGTDISDFNIYTHTSFMPMMVEQGEKVSIQALYGQRVVDVLFDGATFNVIRVDGDYRNTIYEIVGIKH